MEMVNGETGEVTNAKMPASIAAAVIGNIPCATSVIEDPPGNTFAACE